MEPAEGATYGYICAGVRSRLQARDVALRALPEQKTQVVLGGDPAEEVVQGS
jgi:hypothetical protein